MCPGNGHDVKPARQVVAASVVKVVPGGTDEALLLATIDRIGAVAEIGSASISHFDEHDLVAIHHHEIEFAGTDAVIAFDCAQTLSHQIRFCGLFGAATPFRRRRITAPR